MRAFSGALLSLPEAVFFDDIFQDSFDIDSLFAEIRGRLRIDTDDFFDLHLHVIRAGARQVDLIDDRKEF